MARGLNRRGWPTPGDTALGRPRAPANDPEHDGHPLNERGGRAAAAGARLHSQPGFDPLYGALNVEETYWGAHPPRRPRFKKGPRGDAGPKNRRAPRVNSQPAAGVCGARNGSCSRMENVWAKLGLGLCLHGRAARLFPGDAHRPGLECPRGRPESRCCHAGTAGRALGRAWRGITRASGAQAGGEGPPRAPAQAGAAAGQHPRRPLQPRPRRPRRPRRWAVRRRPGGELGSACPLRQPRQCGCAAGRAADGLPCGCADLPPRGHRLLREAVGTVHCGGPAARPGPPEQRRGRAPEEGRAPGRPAGARAGSAQ
jgi:hypothetical protein